MERHREELMLLSQENRQTGTLARSLPVYILQRNRRVLPLVLTIWFLSEATEVCKNLMKGSETDLTFWCHLSSLSLCEDAE